jgi:eukaryotic-like serine/threonine-protein kinase
LAQCCRALTRAHGAGIVHRDIKPENVFLARPPDEDADVVKILDFGVAKITMEVEGWTSSTGTGAVLGTPIFMSPEQVRGAKEIDFRTDLYSLGLVAFTSLTGQLAIDGETFGDVLLKICTHPLPSLCTLAPSLPLAMEAWFHRACAREPVDRHQSAQEFVETLRAAAGESAKEVARITPGPPQPPTLLSAGGGAVVPALGQSASRVSVTGPTVSASAAGLARPQFGAGSVARPMGQTASNVSVTAAVDSGTPAGLPRVRPAAVLAGLGAAVMLALTVVVWLVFSPRAHPSSAALDESKEEGSGVHASGSVPAAPVLAAPIDVLDASSASSNHPSAKPRAPASPPVWVPPPVSPHPPTATVRAPPGAAPTNPLGY